MNLETLEKYAQGGLIFLRKHPHLPLYIANYSQFTQYNGSWDNVTLQCRGLIIDEKSRVVARPFGKFFNYLERPFDHVPWELPYEIYDKLDGSLLIVVDDPEYGRIVSSRGSFTSEQAVKGREILDERYGNWKPIPGFTYLGEIIYPENKIVVDYGSTADVFLVGLIHNESAQDMHLDTPLADVPFPIAKRFPLKFEELGRICNESQENREGFVIRFANGFRLKMKLEYYKQLHAVVTRSSNKTIWQAMKNSILGDFLPSLPDELQVWAKRVANKLQREFDIIREHAYNEYAVRPDRAQTCRNTYAAYVKMCSSPSQLLFALYDGKNIDEMIWKRLEPEKVEFYGKNV